METPPAINPDTVQVGHEAALSSCRAPSYTIVLFICVGVSSFCPCDDFWLCIHQKVKVSNFFFTIPFEDKKKI